MTLPENLHFMKGDVVVVMCSDCSDKEMTSACQDLTVNGSASSSAGVERIPIYKMTYVALL